jgi:hypothetical protein
MRIIALAAAAAIAALATSASAAPASVNVVIGPELQKDAARIYGVRDIDRLADNLQTSVARDLARTGAYADSRIELVLVDAKPNRPTFKQLTDKPGLSFQSFSVGGAEIEGRAIAPDGTVTPLRYSWYESDIRQSLNVWVWHDAEWTFDRFANRLSRGQVVASRD